MRIVGVVLASLFLGIALLPALNFAAKPDDSLRAWSFDVDPPASLPQDFVIGRVFDGRPAGEWKVLKSERAKSPPHVLGQLMGTAEHAYKVVIVQGAKSSNLELEVSLLAVDGKADMGGGLIWHAADDRNYYLTRANPLEQNIRIYRVVKGVRQMLNNFDHIIDVRQWHKLRVIMRGCQIKVFFDEKQVFDLCDKTFREGHVGLWTKSDAVTYFDNLELKILP
jgi:hypothetical protein